MDSRPVVSHYCDDQTLWKRIATRLIQSGKDISNLTTKDLAAVDEFHIRGRSATLELADQMNILPSSHIVDMGCGLGGPARSLAEATGCKVTGVDLTLAFCDAANKLSEWVGLSNRVDFREGDATDLPFSENQFDGGLTIHVAMNIVAKDAMYSEARRVVKPGGIFAIYDVLQGEGGEVLYPVPWARDPSISHLSTTTEMVNLIRDANLNLLEVIDSTEESQSWFESMATKINDAKQIPLSFEIFLGDEFPKMVENQVRNLSERRIRTVTFICSV